MTMQQRLRAFLVTVALVVGAGTMSAVAAPLLRSDDGGRAAVTATESETDGASGSNGEPTEEPTEPVDKPTETVGDVDEAAEDEAKADTHTAAAKKAAREDTRSARAAAKAERDQAKTDRKAAKAGKHNYGQGKGNAHGKAVSDAARGVTAPVGNCRNRGHWVSTVAKGKSSCDDNPKPAKGADKD